MDRRWIQFWLTFLVPSLLSSVHPEAVDITGFEIAVGGTNLVKVHYGGTSSIDLVYDNGTPTNLTAYLDSGTTLPTEEAVIDKHKRTILFPIHSKDITDGFGTYLLTFNLQTEEGSPAIKELVVFHEEPIIGFKIGGSRFIPLLEEVPFMVNLQNGSNVETEWFLDTNDTCLLRHDGTPKKLNLSFTFSVPGTHNVTVVAANTVSRTFDSMLVTAIYKINGLTIEVDKLLSVSRVVLLRVRLSKDAHQPMGSLVMMCDYGDGAGQTEVNLDDKLDKLSGSRGLVQSHKYRSFGTYHIKVKFASKVDEKEFVFSYDAKDTAEGILYFIFCFIKNSFFTIL
ncbi:hypothetical protein FSP39_009265 [Pinctada imbricata]|uniref:PKD domain-containing protein n=1 Tax=Pinctada imbricata TaxID=66713 RepID=A0AA88XQS1_PINIB|nr:hypothetical protein FSP39_009265 [Pinctada imbricata]